MTPWKNRMRANKSVIFKYCHGFVSVIPMSLEFSVEFPITQNGSKSFSGPLMLLNIVRRPLRCFCTFDDIKFSQLFYPIFPGTNARSCKFKTQNRSYPITEFEAFLSKEERLNQQSTEMSEKISCPLNSMLFHLKIKQHCLSAQDSHRCCRQYFYCIFSI